MRVARWLKKRQGAMTWLFTHAKVPRGFNLIGMATAARVRTTVDNATAHWPRAGDKGGPWEAPMRLNETTRRRPADG